MKNFEDQVDMSVAELQADLATVSKEERDERIAQLKASNIESANDLEPFEGDTDEDDIAKDIDASKAEEHKDKGVDGNENLSVGESISYRKRLKQLRKLIASGHTGAETEKNLIFKLLGDSKNTENKPNADGKRPATRANKYVVAGIIPIMGEGYTQVKFRNVDGTGGMVTHAIGNKFFEMLQKDVKNMLTIGEHYQVKEEFTFGSADGLTGSVYLGQTAEDKEKGTWRLIRHGENFDNLWRFVGADKLDEGMVALHAQRASGLVNNQTAVDKHLLEVEKGLRLTVDGKIKATKDLVKEVLELDEREQGIAERMYASVIAGL